MSRVVVVGSGASGVHFVLTALKKGHDVVMLDVGRTGSAPVNPGEDFAGLKRTLPDPSGYFLGERFESVLFPSDASEYYGFPPNKEYVFRPFERLRSRSQGFAPLMSFGRGGLAEAWTAGAYPLNDAELDAFPFGYDELRPHYAEVARRIGINGAADDLMRYFPVPCDMQPPLRLDAHAEQLVDRYQRQRGKLNDRLGCYLGRSRVATLSQDLGDRKACDYSGRCLWGCPNGALYTPSQTLAECRKFANFDYRPGTYVRYFNAEGGRVSSVACESVTTGERWAEPVETLTLAAGTLMSSKIFLESYRRRTGQVPRLSGLMDNRQVMMPFVNPGMAGRQYDPASYQYHQLAMGFGGNDPTSYVHCQITTLKTALIHPIIQGAPFDLGSSLQLLRHLRAALGLVNINLCDTRRDDNYVTLEPTADDCELVVHYRPPADETSRLRAAIRLVKKALRALGCFVPPFMTRVRPMGASVHYAGTIPMTDTPRPLTTSPAGRSHDFENLLFADGTGFPFLPAKNLTYTLMANAVRVAELAL